MIRCPSNLFGTMTIELQGGTMTPQPAPPPAPKPPFRRVVVFVGIETK
jgi:hypothetical protein